MPKNILITDDEETLRFLLRKQLQELGLDADEAQNGLKAAEMARDEDYAIILMDVQMPLMDGLEATRRIREMEHHSGKHATIIALTANPDEEQCFISGMDDYLFKPVDLDSLRSSLRKWSILPSLIVILALIVSFNVLSTSAAYAGYVKEGVDKSAAGTEKGYDVTTGGVKKGAKETAGGTEKAYNVTSGGVKKGYKESVGGTEKAYDVSSGGVKKGWKETKGGTEKAYNVTDGGVKKGWKETKNFVKKVF